MRLALVLAAMLVSLLGWLPATGATPRASLRLVDDTTPATLRGVGFRSREHVKVTLMVGKASLVRRRIATVHGTFSVRLVIVDVNACTGFSAIAVGSKGTRATLKRAPGQCPDLQP